MANFTSTSRHSDAVRLVASKTFVTPADGTHMAIRIPQWAFVTRVWTNITTGYTNAGATFTADTDAFMGTAAVQPTVAALRSSNEDNNPASQGKYFDSAGGMITVTIDDNGGTAGTFTVFAEYYVIH